jgi:hypothetical protein
MKYIINELDGAFKSLETKMKKGRARAVGVSMRYSL